MRKFVKDDIQLRLLMASAIFAVLGFSGCATAPEKVAVQSATEPVVVKPEYVVVDFDSVEVPEEVKRVEDRNSPEEVISFARSLSNKGRNREAALIYLDAAKRFRSRSGRFENDCKKAAVREEWLDGDFESAKKLLKQMEAEQDIYTAASEADSLRKLRHLLEAGIQ